MHHIIHYVSSVVLHHFIEYAVPVYHSMLTQAQSLEIEKLQRRIMKLIFGHKISYCKVLERTGVPTLEARRQEIFNKVAKKLSEN